MNDFDALREYAEAERERANRAEAKLARVRALADEWEGYGHGRYNIHLEERLPCSACDLLAGLRALLDEGES